MCMAHIFLQQSRIKHLAAAVYTVQDSYSKVCCGLDGGGISYPYLRNAHDVLHLHTKTIMQTISCSRNAAEDLQQHRAVLVCQYSANIDRNCGVLPVASCATHQADEAQEDCLQQLMEMTIRYLQNDSSGTVSGLAIKLELQCSYYCQP